MRTTLVISISLLMYSLVQGQNQWLQYAGDEHRSGTAGTAPAGLSAVLWTASEYPAGTTIRFEGPSSPVVWNGRVYANARHYVGNTHTQNKIVALDQASGGILFQTFIDQATLDSWSSPAVDEIGGSVLLGCRMKLYCIDAVNGPIRWATPLARSVVNASPLVAGETGRRRAFITDYDGFGSAASLYCVNLSLFESGTNPYQPGDIVWQEPIGGSSGNTPAYDNGVVYVSSVSGGIEGCEDLGHVYAFDVDAPAGSRLIWSTCVGEGFFGGVCYANGHLFAASYNPAGSSDNSTLAKIRASDGVIVWTTACERTASMPVVVGDRVFLAAGIQGFGSTPKVEAFQDNGASAAKLWDTFADTGGAMIVGGWTHQPLFCNGILYTGRIPLSGSFYGAYTDLFMLDINRMPGDPAFIRSQLAGSGSSPAAAGGRVYLIGPGGLSAIALRGDCHADGVLDGNDLSCFVQAFLNPGISQAQIRLFDFGGDGLLDTDDIPGMVSALLVN
jgi:outer membrane protein assembly factor BamB